MLLQDIIRDEWFLTLFDMVRPEQCDSMGHLTVKEYMAFFDIAEWHTFTQCGFHPSMIDERKLGYADIDHKISYAKELHAGHSIIIRSSILRLGRKSITAKHEMWNGTLGELSATMESVSLQFDLRTRRSVELIPEIRARVPHLKIGAERQNSETEN